jgi:hypothetical protein
VKTLVIVAALLVSAGPSFASPQHPTPAQLKDIDSYYHAFSMCQNYNPDSDSYPNPTTSKEENKRFKKACDRYEKLGSKLVKQGFCSHKYNDVGRPGKNGDCEALPDH